MKKIFDKYLFSRAGLQIVVSIIAILVFSILMTCIKNNVTLKGKNDFYNRMTWGFRQIADSGSVALTMEQLDRIDSQEGNVPVVIGIALIAWISGLVLCSFVTGAIVNAFDGRKSKIESGKTRYRFKNHGIVLGWDYQGMAVVKNMFSERGIKEVLIVSEIPPEEIRGALSRGFDQSEMKKIYIYNCSINVKKNIEGLQAEAAKIIVILGEQKNYDKDGGTLHTERTLRKYIKDKIQNVNRSAFTNLPIKLYLHIEDPLLYTQARAKKDGFVEDEIFDLELCNFYESWAWKCWSQIDSSAHDQSSDQAQHYLPLRYKKDSERVELFVIGSNAMGQAFINHAIPLMNYGQNGKHCRISLFDDENNGQIFLPKKRLINMLPEVEIVRYVCNGSSDEANDIMSEAIKRNDTSVTIVIAVPGADSAVKIYTALSHEIRNEQISVLVWQATESINCIDKGFLQTGGDRVMLRYFGMTDILPWADPHRDEHGRNINYFYNVINQFIKQEQLNKVEPAERFLSIAKQALQSPFGDKEKTEAAQQWYGIKRWKRWSSINAGDSFKEKAFAFPDVLENAETCVTLLKSEHNRWWTERLLAGWLYGERDDEQFRHPALIEFEKLDAEIQMYDLLCILAMVHGGTLKQ